jgi:hypothetical protein
VSRTIVDMAKVTQAMDSGWEFRLFKGGMGDYCVIAEGNETQMQRLHRKDEEYRADHPDYPFDWGPLLDMDEECVTTDFTPEQALTRAAYKVLGEILNV